MRKFRKFSVLLLIIAAFLVSAAVFPASAANAHPKATIKTSDVNLRAGAGTSYNIIGNMTKDEKVTLLDGRLFNKEWYHIKKSDGVKGYVHQDYLSINKNQLYIVDAVNVYAGYAATYRNFVNTTEHEAVWSSSDKTIATVSAGKVTPHKAGTVTITVHAGDKKVKSKLTVKKATVTLDKKSLTIYTDDSPVKLKAKCAKAVTFTSSKKTVATVSNKGVVTPKGAGTTKIKAASKSGEAVCTVTVKKRVITLKCLKSAMYTDNYDIITPSGGKEAYTFKSSNKNIVKVDRNGWVHAVGSGKATVTITSGKLKKTKTYNIKAGSLVSLSNLKGNVNAGKTLYVKSFTSGVKWKTSDSKIATVNGGYVLGKKKGKVIISASTSKGAKDCVVTVKGAEPVRFVYTSNNSAFKGKTFKLYAITDTLRTNVKFKITRSDGKKKWITKTTKTTSSGRYIWTGETDLKKAGVYTINAYAHKKGTKWATSDGGETNFIVNSYTSRATPTFAQKRVTTSLLKNIAQFEGFLPKVEADQLVADSPTVGYGHVTYAGTTFYNGMTKKEAFAFLTKDINNSGYTIRVNKLLKDNKIKFTQSQFDALVDFSYNLGPYAIENDNDLMNVLKNTYGKTSNKLKGYIRVTSSPLKKTAASDAKTLKTLAPNATVTLSSTKVYNNSWYKVKTTDGTEGYVKTSHIERRTTDTKTRDLRNINYNSLKSNILPYHHASGSCYWGLLYRRIDEIEMFYFRDYTVDGANNDYNMKYYCSRNKSFGMG